MIKITDEILMSYADGELEEEVAIQVEKVIASDASLRDKVTRHHALRTEFDLAFKNVNETPIPDSIMGLLQENNSNIVSLPTKTEFQSKQWWQPTAIAASIVVAFLVGMLSNVTENDFDLLTVDSSIANLLDKLPMGSSEMDIILQGSFLKDDGSFCRTFQDTNSDTPMNGLSCRKLTGDWAIISLIPAVPENAYLPASGDTESIIDQQTEPMQTLSRNEEKKYLKQ